MSVNGTMAYHSTYRSSYVPSTASTLKPYRSTYSTDFVSPRTTSSSLYKSSTYIPSLNSGSSGYGSSSRTLPSVSRNSGSSHLYDHSSRTLPLRACATSSFESSRTNYERSSYLSSRRDSDRFSSFKPSVTSSLSNRNLSSVSSDASLESCRPVSKHTDDAEKDNGEMSASGHGHRGSSSGVKQLGGSPDATVVDNNPEARSQSHDDRHVRRSPSIDRVTRDSASARSKRFQSVDRNGASETIPYMASLNANTDKGRTGLRNLGNTCFMNSVLQCLSNTRPLLEFCLVSTEHEPEINYSTSRMKGDLISSFIKLMQSMWGGHDFVSPTDFKSEVSRFARRFGGYNQQDAQEFLISLLEGLQDDLNRVRSKNKKRHIDCSNDVETISASDKARESWKRYLEFENSKIVDIFVGQLKSALTCLECGYVSNTFDPFLDLSLPIPKGRSMSTVSLLDCFELFTQEEILEGDERPTCARCKKRQKCTKRFSIQKFPQILIIHLKRFSQDYALRSKLSTDVKCPTKNLDLKKFSAEKSAGNISYDLYAVSNHSGTPSGGHYTASAKNPYTGQWHYFNDQRVSSASEAGVISSEAYILFYELSSNG